MYSLGQEITIGRYDFILVADMYNPFGKYGSIQISGHRDDLYKVDYNSNTLEEVVEKLRGQFED